MHSLVPAPQKDLLWHHCHQIGCTRLAPLPQLQVIFRRLFSVHPSRSRVPPFRWTLRSARLSTWTAHFSLSFLLPLTLTRLWLFSLFPRGPRSHQARGSHMWMLAEWRYVPGYVHRGIHDDVSNRVLLATASFALAPLPVAGAPSPHAVVYELVPPSA